MCLKISVTILLALQVSGGSGTITGKDYISMPQLFHLDDFDRCMIYEEEALYCSITFKVQPQNAANPSKIWKIIEEVSSKTVNYRHDLLRHGICIPETCPNITTYTQDGPEFRAQVTECYNQKYKHMGLQGEVVKIKCQTNESPYPFGLNEILYAGFVVLYVLFVAFASLYEGLARYKSQEEYHKMASTSVGTFIVAFSIPKNWYRLKTIDHSNPEVKDLSCIQGIRVYNMVIVILVHTVMINLAVPVANPIWTERMTEKFLNVFLANGGYAVQTFFMITVLLVTYNILKSSEGKKRMSLTTIGLAFLNRYIRLAPTLAIVVFFHCTWFVHLSRGPVWDEIIGEEYRRCKENGWTNLLFINNYINEQRMCMPQTWYMAIDTQYFLATLLLLSFIWYNKRRLYAVVFTIIAAHMAILFTIIYWNNWESTLRPFPEDVYLFGVIDRRQWHMILGSNYCHLPGLALGLLSGHLLYYHRKTTIFDSKKIVVFWWVTVWIFCLGIIVLPGMIMYAPGYEHNRLYAALYGCLSRTIFISGMAFAIYGFIQGVGWMMKWTLEWAPTYILGRLTFSAFLIHVSLQKARIGELRAPKYVSDNILVHELLGDIAMSYIAALIIALLVEYPLSEVQKMVMPAKKVAKKTEGGVKKVE